MWSILWNKYKNISLPAKASLWFVICNIIQKGIAFITTPLFTRFMEMKEYGIVIIYQSWKEIVAIIVTFKLYTGVFNKAMIKYENDRDGYTSSSLFLTSMLTILFFLLFSLYPSFWNEIFDLTTIVICMMFVDILFSTAMSFYSIRNRFEYKYKSVILFTLLVAVLGPVLSLVMITNVDIVNQAEARIFGMLAVRIAIYAIVFIIIFKKGKKIIDCDYWRYSLKYNLPLVPHYLSQQVLTQSDRIMINKFCGAIDAAIYGVAYQLSNVCFIFTLSIHNSFTPWTFENLRDKKYEEIGRVALKIEIAVGVICFFFSLFAPELIWILGGKNYSEAVWIVPPVAMSILFQTIYTFFANIEFYFEKSKLVMIASMIVAVANIILNAIFIPIFGFVAAGYTTLACYILYSIVHYVFMSRICKVEGVPEIYSPKLVWGIAIAGILLSISVSFLYNYTVIRYVVIVFLFMIIVAFVVKYKNYILQKIKS